MAFVLAGAVLVTPSWLAAAASAGFALSTLGAYLLAVWSGLFGFKEIRTRAGIAAGLIEVAAFGLLALAAIAAGPKNQADEPVSRGPVAGQVHMALSMVIAGIGAVSVAALALLGVAEATAGAQPAVASGGATLRTAAVGGAIRPCLVQLRVTHPFVVGNQNFHWLVWSIPEIKVSHPAISAGWTIRSGRTELSCSDGVFLEIGN